jgi:hypothetical protein
VSLDGCSMFAPAKAGAVCCHGIKPFWMRKID